MSLLKIIPQIFYKEINDGIDLFVHTDFSNGDRPELRIATNDIESVYREVKSRQPALLHPNLKKIKQQPWGLKEFALLDKTGVCIIIQQTAD